MNTTDGGDPTGASGRRNRRGWVLLMKFGRREHLESLRRGEVFMNSLEYFGSLGDDPARSDAFEGSDHIVQPKDLKNLTIVSKDWRLILEPCQLKGPLRIGLGKRPRMNVFCMYGIQRPIPVPLVGEGNQQFGDSFIIVIDTSRFVAQIAAAARRRGLDIMFGPVEYYDPERHSGETGPFRKPAAFAYQREFRIVAYPGNADPIRLEVGSLEGLTTRIFPLTRINELVKIPIA